MYQELVLKGKKNETGILFSADEPGRKAGLPGYVRWLYGAVAGIPGPSAGAKRAVGDFFQAPVGPSRDFLCEQFHLSLFRPGRLRSSDSGIPF